MNISIPGRIPVYIHPFFWLLVIFIGWLNSETLLGITIWTFVILISILVHEFGHALTALAFGQTAEIHLMGMGGITRRNGPNLTKWKEFLITLNGPLAGFALFFCALFLFVHSTSNYPTFIYMLRIFIEVNLFWTLLNLIPVLPLDGGHLLRIILEKAFGWKGLKISFLSSLVLAALLGVYFLMISQIFISAIFIMMAFESYRNWVEIKDVTENDHDSLLKEELNKGLEALKAEQKETAFTYFNSIRKQAPKGMIYVTATEYGSRILAEQGQYKQAYEWLMPLQNRLSTDYLRLLHQLAYRVQEWEETIKIGQKLYPQEPSSETAILNALSYAILGQAQPTIGWLSCAAQQGYIHLSTIIKKRELDTVRQTPEFQTWIKTQNE